MSSFESFSTVEQSLPVGESMVIHPHKQKRIVVRTIYHGGAADIIWEADPGGDGSFPVSVQIDSLAGEGISQQNEIEIEGREPARLRVVNTGTGPADYSATGEKFDL